MRWSGQGDALATGSAVVVHLSGGVGIVVGEALIAHADDARGYQRVVLRIPLGRLQNATWISPARNISDVRGPTCRC